MYSAKELAIARLIKPDIEVTQLDVTDLAVLQLVRKATGGGSGVYDATIENGIATFGGVVASQPLVSLLLNLPVTQTGSGTPSPTNIRDFVGVSQAVIGQTSGYGEYFRGLLNGTYGFVDLGSLSYEPHTTYGATNTFRTPITDKANGISNLICVGYSNYSGSVPDMPNMSVRGQTSANILYVKNTSCSTGSEMATALNGVYLIFELATPTSTPITPEQFATLCQAFGITGNTYTISFGQTVYSAILNVLNGKLYATHGIVDLGNYTYHTSKRPLTNNRDGYSLIMADLPFYPMVEKSEPLGNLCEIFNETYQDATSWGVNSFVFIDSGSNYFQDRRIGFIINSGICSTPEEFRNYVRGYKLYYKLAEPIEIDITPTVINTLIGENVIFADVADVTECKYTRK